MAIERPRNNHIAAADDALHRYADWQVVGDNHVAGYVVTRVGEGQGIGDALARFGAGGGDGLDQAYLSRHARAADHKGVGVFIGVVVDNGLSVPI